MIMVRRGPAGLWFELFSLVTRCGGGCAGTTGDVLPIVAVTTAGHETSRPDVYLIGLLDDGWAAIYGERRYRLHGNPAGRFWWTAGLCRFEPGELDGYGVERLFG